MCEPHAPCRAVVVACIDYRCQHQLHAWLAERGVERGRYDHVSVPGGAAALLDATETALDLSLRLHRPTRILLTAHSDCGAGATREDLERAHAEVSAAYPEARVEQRWLELERPPP